MMKQAKNILGGATGGSKGTKAFGFRGGDDPVLAAFGFARAGTARGRRDDDGDAALEAFFRGEGRHEVLVAGDASDGLLVLV